MISLRSFCPELAFDRILPRVNHIQTVVWRRRFHVHVHPSVPVLCYRGSAKRQHIFARARRMSQSSPEKQHLRTRQTPGPDVLTQRAVFLLRVLKPDHFAGQIGLASLNNRTVHSCIDHRRQSKEQGRS